MCPAFCVLVLPVTAGVWWLVAAGLAEVLHGQIESLFAVLIALVFALVMSTVSWVLLALAVNWSQVTLARPQQPRSEPSGDPFRDPARLASGPEATREPVVVEVWKGPVPLRWGWTRQERKPTQVSYAMHSPVSPRGSVRHEVTMHTAGGTTIDVGSFDSRDEALALREILERELDSLSVAGGSA